jgi:hypothetical protein
MRRRSRMHNTFHKGADVQKKMFSLKKFQGYFLLLIITLFPLASIQAIMQLIPPIQEIEVQRGYKGAFTVTINNTGDEDVPCKFSAHDLDITVEGRPFISDSGWTRGCGQWIELEPTECIIKAHESLTLQGTIAVPRTAEGGYYALIKGTFVGTTIPLSAEEVDMQGSKIALESQAVVAVVFTVPSSRNKPELVPETLFVYPRGEEEKSGEGAGLDFGAKKGWKVVMPVRNEGNIHTRVSGQASIWSEGGTRMGSAPLQAGRGYLLPGKVRNLTATGGNILTDGYYMLRIVLQTAKRSSMSNSFAFAVYEGEVYPGAITDAVAELIRASSPGFSLREPFKQQKITPGGRTYLAIQMKNTVRDTLTLIPRKMEWNLDQIGQPTLGSDSLVQPRSCTPWIEFVEDKILLPPGRTKSFKLTVHSPKGVSGEFYSAIVFDPDRPRPDLPAEFMAARTQLIAVRSPKGLNYEIEVDSIKVKKESSPELTLYRFLFGVRNTGNAHCFVTGSMSLEKEAAKGVYKRVGKAHDFGDTQTYLLPGGERAFEIDIPNMDKGRYRIILAVNYKEETQPVMKYQPLELN